MKLSDATDVVAVIQANYNRHPWPDPTVNLATSELVRLPLNAEDALEAARRLIRSRASEWPPTPSEVVRSMVADVDAAPSFDEAWAEMARKASAGNYFRPNEAPAMSHPAVDALARLIGWRNFTTASATDDFFRRSAERVYGGVLEDRTRLVLEYPERTHALGAGEAPELRELVAGIGVGGLVHDTASDGPDGGVA